MVGIGIVLHDLSLGGTEHIALRLARQWRAEGASVTIFCGSTSGELVTLVPDDARLVEAEPPVERRRRSRRRLGRSAAAHFAAEPVDVCFIPGNFHWPLITPIAGVPSAVRPAIVAQISAALHKPQRGLLSQRWFEARMRKRLRQADGIVAISQLAFAQADAILGAGLLRHIPLPALSEDQPPPVPVPSGNSLLLAAGRLVREKGFATLIEAFALLPEPGVRLAILGSGPEEERLRRHVAALGLEKRVQLPGYVPDVRPWLDRCRLFILPSQHEGYAAVLLEALAAGRPVVASDCSPAIAEIPIAGEVGCVVPIGDPVALVQAIGLMLSRPLPAPAALASRVAQHAVQPVAREYLRLFRQVARQGGA